ncbi:major facilitator superfamily domain-containing protein [Diplogelasinospora grovesii]|uniref:Major facilitator superfamily domain-containing protein n=1 Tax=Diplogelasinospora grovesii TaxID=303347 RepID=A0AAN6NJS5_9PEZI|nr:major facilitator superfamily domain-containing protein [Diplogelasinospora grovesii]
MPTNHSTFITTSMCEIEQLNWIITSFNLTSSCFIPLWGQMADIFGRHVAIQSSVLTMLVGSALCTGAPTSTFPVLLLGRCAGISVIVRVMLADKVSLEENAKNWSLFSFTGGIAYGIGPVVGGWCFGINLPIGVVGMLIILLILREELLGPQPIQTIVSTSAGKLLFLFGFGLMILAFTSWPVMFLGGGGGVLTCAWAVWEYLMSEGRWQRAMVPWRIIRNRNIGLLFYTTFATGAAIYAVLYFVNLYFTMVKLYSPSQAGVQLLYWTSGLGVGVYSSMFMCNVYPRKTFVPILLGSVIEAAGVGVLAWALWGEHTPTIFGMMALTGVGTGLRFMPAPLHAIGFFSENTASVLAFMAVALPLGGTLALTVMATVFNNTSGIGASSPLRDFTVISNLPEPLRSTTIHNAKMGVVWAFVALTPFMVVCIIAAMLLGNVNITKDRTNENGAVISDVYLLRLLRRDKEKIDGESTISAEASKTEITPA